MRLFLTSTTTPGSDIRPARHGVCRQCGSLGGALWGSAMTNWSFSSKSREFKEAFTLVELLVVLAIIGLVLALSLPNFRASSEGAALEAAKRQLINDLQFARQNAIATRSTVAVVFVPRDVLIPSYVNPSDAGYSATERTNLYRLQGGPLTTYAVFGFRHVGDQPGAGVPRYITPWRTLPEKTFIAEAMFNDFPPYGFHWATNAPFPFPLGTSGKRTVLPYIAFNPEGQCLPVLNSGGFTDAAALTRNDDIIISLANGVVNYTRDPATGQVIGFTAQEIPPNNSTNELNAIHIDWLTGRARLEQADVVSK